jgi:hypothetical protein
MRATMSVPPPGGNATMMRTGFAGNCCALICAGRKTQHVTPAAKAAIHNLIA